MTDLLAILAVLICAIILLLAIRRRSSYFAVMTLSLVFLPDFGRVSNWVGTNAAWGGVLAAIGLILLLTNFSRIRASNVGIGYGCFLVWCLARIIGSPDTDYAVRMFFKLSVPYIAFLAGQSFPYQEWKYSDLLKCLFWIASITSVIVGGAIRRWSPLVADYGDVLFLSEAPYAMYCSAAAITLAIGSTTLGVRKYSWAAWWLIIDVVISGSRIPFLAAAVGFSVYSAICRRSVKHLIGIPLACVALFCSLLFIPAFSEKMFYDGVGSVSTFADLRSLDLADINTNGRLLLWDHAFREFFLPNPIVGSGLGATQHFFYQGEFGERALVLHNDHLRLLSEVGLVGWALYIGTLISMASVSCRALNSSIQSVRGLAATTLVAFVMLAIFMITDNPIDYFAVSVPPFGMFGMLLNRARLKKEQVFTLSSRTLISKPCKNGRIIGNVGQSL